jgi:hypothetical protein
MRLPVLLILALSSSALADTSVSRARGSDEELLRPKRLAGPFSTLTSYCEAERKRWSDPQMKCSLDRPREECAVRDRPAPSPLGPFREVKMISVGYSCDLAIRTARGWFVGEADSIPGARNATTIDSPVVTATGPGKSPQVLVRVNHTYWFHENDENITEWNACENSILVCGIVPSGHPACTSPLPLEWAEYCEYAESDDPRPAGSGLPRWRWQMTATLLGGGKLVLRRVAVAAKNRALPTPFTGPPPREPPVGRFQLTWP